MRRVVPLVVPLIALLLAGPAQSRPRPWAAGAAGMAAHARAAAGTDRPPAADRAAAAAAPAADLAPCGDPPGWLCGHVDVPLDRSHPDGPTVPVVFQVLPHTDTSQPALEP